MHGNFPESNCAITYVRMADGSTHVEEFCDPYLAKEGDVALHFSGLDWRRGPSYGGKPIMSKLKTRVAWLAAAPKRL